MNIDAQGSTFEEKNAKKANMFKGGGVPGSSAEIFRGQIPHNREGEMMRIKTCMKHL
jgi:hypothetical protein